MVARVARVFGARFMLGAVGLLFTVSVARGQEQASKGLDGVPKPVMDGLKTRFPKALIHKWSMETEADLVIYDVEFTQEGKKYEADIKDDGTIHNWEQEVTAKDLPRAVRDAVEKKYPQSVLKEIMRITAVEGREESVEGYEILVETADGEEVEITLASDGRVLEESREGP